MLLTVQAPNLMSLFPLRSSYQIISPGARHMYTFRNNASFYGGELLAPYPAPELKDHPLSAVWDCLFNIFAPIYTGVFSSICHLRTRHAVVTGILLANISCSAPCVCRLLQPVSQMLQVTYIYEVSSIGRMLVVCLKETLVRNLFLTLNGHCRNGHKFSETSWYDCFLLKIQPVCGCVKPTK